MTVTNKIFLLNFISLFFIASNLEALPQEKFERESRIPEKEVPAVASIFIDSIPGKGNVRWYLEESLEETSIEAKFKRQGKRYSIEFDSLGILQDIEILVKMEEIPSGISEKIITQLSNHFEVHKVDRTQIQYRGKPSVLLGLVRDGISKDEYFISYELVIRGKDSNGWKMYEYRFSSGGEIESITEVIQRNTDNLEF